MGQRRGRFSSASRSWFLRARTAVLRRVYPLLFRADVERGDLVRLGSAYGGWWVPSELLGRDDVCYCVGVGLDDSFDVELLRLFNVNVWSVDPTPGVVSWMSGRQLPVGQTFVPCGVAGENGELRFYGPADPTHISHSVKNLQETRDFFTARVVTLATLASELGHAELALVKLDIEGAEHDALRRAMRDGIRPRIICVEFDQPEPLGWAFATVRLLRHHGYVLCKVDGFNLTFVRE